MEEVRIMDTSSKRIATRELTDEMVKIIKQADEKE